MYCDLNIRKRGQSNNDPLLVQLLGSCIEGQQLLTKKIDNYEAVAINYQFRDTILLDSAMNTQVPQVDLESHTAQSINIQQNNVMRKAFTQLSRVTLDLSEMKYLHQIQDTNKILQSYDIIAVKPRTDKILMTLCNDFDYFDIVTFDCFDKLPFIPKMNIVQELVQKGIYFEINYSDAITDQNRRRMFISNAMILIKATKGKNIIFSSDTSNWLHHRSPYDLVALGITLGMKKDTSYEAINKNPTNVIKRARHRKAYKGTVCEATQDDVAYFKSQKDKKQNLTNNNNSGLMKQLNSLRKKVKISKDLYKSILDCQQVGISNSSQKLIQDQEQRYIIDE